MSATLIERDGRRFRLPAGDSVSVTGETVILESRRAGGQYRLLGAEESPLEDAKVIRVGALELGWWNGAPPGMPCEYPFPE